jgi:adenine-specific DNA-methyltransferase
MGSGNEKMSSEFDYVLIYSKSSEFEFNPLPMGDGDLSIYDQADQKGRYLLRSLRRTGGENKREDRPSMFFPVYAPDGTEVLPLAPEGWESRWVCSEATYKELLRTGYIEWKKVNKNGIDRWQVYQKHYVGEALKYASNNWNDLEGNKKATRDLNDLFDGKKVFDHPKPIAFIERIVQISTRSDSEDLVVDFFAGSATTAHAVVNQNVADSGNRRFILIQLAESLDPGNSAQLVAHNFCVDNGLSPTVAEIAKERVRRVVKQNGAVFLGGSTMGCGGVRVLKTDSSNMADVFYAPDATNQGALEGFTDNIKPDRSPEDLLFQVMLDWGVDLALPITRQTIQGRELLFVDGNALSACFDAGGRIDEAFVKELATHKPLRAVFRDAGFADSAAKINVEQIFKLLSPGTEVKCL